MATSKVKQNTDYRRDAHGRFRQISINFDPEAWLAIHEEWHAWLRKHNNLSPEAVSLTTYCNLKVKGKLD